MVFNKNLNKGRSTPTLMPFFYFMNILIKANEIINERKEEKEREYGPIDESLCKAALIASELTNKSITLEDFYKCMIALKISRMAYNLKEDTMLDAVAYISALNNYKNGKNV